MMQNLRSFHIDMNVGHFTFEYLEKWLHILAEQGYNAVIWELENAVHWRTCPECVAPEAFSKENMSSLLKLCRDLGMAAIPLFQTLGHCEYVLKHPRYRPLAELPDRIDQYCPLHPNLLPLLTAWIDEYLELFGSVPMFHLGADEAWTLGECPHCRDYAARRSLSELYIQHVNQLSDHLRKQNVRPAIWADMVLHHPEALSQLSRDVVLFDWLYDLHHGQGKVYVWGQGMHTRDTLPPETLRIFGSHLFPQGDEPGREPETFYTADFLAAQGFDVVTCPSSSSARDNIFAPRMYYHLANTGDMFRKGSQAHLRGSLLTSWTVHLFPWELQQAAIELPGFLASHPQAALNDFELHYSREHFDLSDRRFFEAASLLSKSCIFSDRPGSGHFKDCRGAPADHVRRMLNQLQQEERMVRELDNARLRLTDYQQAATILADIPLNEKSRTELPWWRLAARNLIHRARMTIWILSAEMASRDGTPMPDDQARLTLLLEMNELRDKMEIAYRPILKSSRRAQVLDWIFGPWKRHLHDFSELSRAHKLAAGAAL